MSTRLLLSDLEERQAIVAGRLAIQVQLVFQAILAPVAQAILAQATLATVLQATQAQVLQVIQANNVMEPSSMEGSSLYLAA